MSGWDAVWARRVAQRGGASLLADLMAADGLDSGFASVAPDAFSDGVRRLARRLGLVEGSSAFEVGCGAGAFLHELAAIGCEISGLDLSPDLIARAREALPSGTFSIGDAASLPCWPQADAVLSFGVFLYFPSPAYAEEVLDRMVAKARRVVAVLDLPDMARRGADICRRVELAGGEAAYTERYRGLEHLYFRRAEVAGALTARGLVDVTVESQSLEGYGNGPFRFNAWGYKPR
jgi:trans-aconitate methyltransferase